MRTGSRVLILVILILARLRSPIAAGEHPKQQGTPSSLKPEDFWIARNDFEALAAELAAAIAADEKLFVPEKTAQACGDNERKASNRVHRLGWYLWLANPEKAGPVLMKHFKETRYGTTRAQLCRWLGHCPSGEALQVLMDAWREEPTYGYRNAYFKAITQCSAETKLNWYAEVLSADEDILTATMTGIEAGTGSGVARAVRDLSRYLRNNLVASTIPSVREKESGLDLDSKQAASWRKWFTDTRPYMEWLQHSGKFTVNMDAKACKVPVRNWTRLMREKREELAGKSGRGLPEEVRGETPDRKVERLASGLKAYSFVDRRNSARRLGRMGPVAKGAIAVLEKTLRDENASVRKAAADALGSIRSAPAPRLPDHGNTPAEKQLERRSGPQLADPAKVALSKLGSALEAYALQDDLVKAKAELRAADEIIHWLPDDGRKGTTARLRSAAAGLGGVIERDEAQRADKPQEGR